jgi:cyclopropane fatty-acyl-phospholipid synthase-like methyltransferase
MSTESHPRFRWAREIINPNPKERILEIGCGTGLLVEEIVPYLKAGKITAIDRSSAMIAKAIKRNAESITKGRAEFVKADWLDFVAGRIRYDKVIFFNINFFWTQASVSREAEFIRSLLSEKGSVYIFYGPMFNGGFEKISTLLSPNLSKAELPIRRTIHHQELRCCCFIA